MKNNRDSQRFEILKQVAVAAAQGEDTTAIAQTALSQAAELVGLEAVSLFLWDENFRVTTTVSHAHSEEHRQKLNHLEEELFTQLRREKHLVSAYLTFSGEPPYHTFTFPLWYGKTIFGAVIGLQVGEKTLISEDDFLETLSALLSLHYTAQRLGSTTSSKEALDKERLSAIVETAVAVNHEVNNPLTAILGNVQLLLLKRDDLDEDLVAKLKTIETSALKIKEVTQRLMRITNPRSVEYSEGTKMLDLSSDEEESS